MNKYNYLLVFTLPLVVLVSFHLPSAWSFLPVFIYFFLVPILELLIPPIPENETKSDKKAIASASFFQIVLQLTVPVQVCLLIYFLIHVTSEEFTTLELTGHIVSMGLACGVLGLNVGHELGHRPSRWEQLLGEIMLFTSMNSHFLPYHNAGHHQNVATPIDAATARKNEILFLFWIRSHFTSYAQAWEYENKRLRAIGSSILSHQNRMVVYTLVNIGLIACIAFLFGTLGLLAFLGAAVVGILLLETVNYIEHYGLLRKQLKSGRYERVRHTHSWNSDHVLGRSILFNLSRHSDHHYNGSKPYQLLDSLERSPQMPTGYPGMMLLALAQPIWFTVMNKKLNELNASN